jgi:hypothetical protein
LRNSSRGTWFTTFSPFRGAGGVVHLLCFLCCVYCFFSFYFFAASFYVWCPMWPASLELRNNSPVFEEFEVSIVDLTFANTVLLATQSGASKSNIRDRQLFKYSTVFSILMKLSQRVHTSLKTYK